MVGRALSSVAVAACLAVVVAPRSAERASCALSPAASARSESIALTSPAPPVAPRPPAAPTAPPAASAHAAAAPEAREPTLLLLGDSHCYGAFGARLHERLAASGRFAVVSEAAGGATTETYLEDAPEAMNGYRVRYSARGEAHPRELVHRTRAPMHNLDQLLTAHDPAVVVVALGTNRPKEPAAASYARFMDRLTQGDRARRVLWVGPPAFGRDSAAQITRVIRSAVEGRAGATFVDSTSFNALAPLPAENPHFGPVDATRWADVTYARLAPSLERAPGANASPR